MPPHFSSTYTPIAAAGTPEQIRHVARLLASQLNNVGIGPGAKSKQAKEEKTPVVRLTFNTVFLGG